MSIVQAPGDAKGQKGGGCEEKEAPVMAIWMGKDGTILGK